MPLRDSTRNRFRDVSPALLGVAVPAIVFGVVVLLGLWAHPFEYDTDEGLNLMKAALVARGHSLYGEIWSDQPPLHTLILAQVFEVAGQSVMAARVLTAVFSALLIGSLFDLVRRLSGTRAALLAAALLFVSAWYLKLSFSIMIGLPALALATASLALLVRSGQARGPRAAIVLLVLSAFTMSAAVAVKLLAAVAIPAGALLAWKAEARPGRALAWLGVIVASCAAIAVITMPSPGALLGTHLSASQLRDGNWIPVMTLMRSDQDLIVLSLLALGIWYGGRGLEGRATSAVPLVWLLCGAVAAQFHRPLWYHHSLLVTIPAAWVTAEALEHVLRSWAGPSQGPRARWLARATWVWLGVFALLALKLDMSVRRMFEPIGPDDGQVVEAMRRHAPQTTWAFSDRPMYAFAAGLVLPPEIAVVSNKRRDTGRLSDDLVVRVLRTYRPEQVLLARIDFGPEVTDYVDEHYVPTGRFRVGSTATLYLRRGALPAAPRFWTLSGGAGTTGRAGRGAPYSGP